ncbi:hypothetical protein V8C86DRAFT_433883 [Haematococcus lacustris]
MLFRLQQLDSNILPRNQPSNVITGGNVPFGSPGFGSITETSVGSLHVISTMVRNFEDMVGFFVITAGIPCGSVVTATGTAGLDTVRTFSCGTPKAQALCCPLPPPVRSPSPSSLPLPPRSSLWRPPHLCLWPPPLPHPPSSSSFSPPLPSAFTHPSTPWRAQLTSQSRTSATNSSCRCSLPSSACRQSHPRSTRPTCCLTACASMAAALSTCPLLGRLVCSSRPS